MTSRELLLASPRELLMCRTFSTSEDLENQTEQNLPQHTQGTVAVLTREIVPAAPFSSLSLRQHRIRPLLPSHQEPPTENG